MVPSFLSEHRIPRNLRLENYEKVANDGEAAPGIGGRKNLPTPGPFQEAHPTPLSISPFSLGFLLRKTRSHRLLRTFFRLKKLQKEPKIFYQMLDMEKGLWYNNGR